MKKRIQNVYTGLIALVVMAFASTNVLNAQDVQTQQNAQNQDVFDVIQSSEEHTIFASLLEDADMKDSLKNGGDFTVIAPTDEAFEEMDGEVYELRANPDELESFVDAHIENGEEKSANMQQERQRTTETERNTDRKKDKGEKEVIKASNGEVVVVDKVKDKDKDKKG